MDGRKRFEYATSGRVVFPRDWETCFRFQKYPDACGRVVRHVFGVMFEPDSPVLRCTVLRLVLRVSKDAPLHLRTHYTLVYQAEGRPP